jgi:ATP-dependent 26S proteasome regulatory subunit
MIRDAFDLAKEKCKDRGGAIIFIDEVRCTPCVRCTAR